MPSLQFGAGAAIAIGIVFVALGVLAGSACGGGTAFVYFGIGAMLIGAGIAMLGAVPVVIATTILGAVLIGVGWHLGSIAGCSGI